MEIQKKWFIYVGDHHEGPFSAEDLYEKKKANAAKEESYVWCEGMVDWQMISQVPELQQELKKLTQNESLKKDPTPKKNLPADTKNKKSGKIIGIIAATAIVLFIATIATFAILSRTASEDFHSSLRPNLNRLVDRFPVLSGVFKLIPTLTDVKPEELKDLEEGITGSPDTNVKVAMAVSQTDPNRPFFYLTSNLPHRTKLDLYLVGNRDTLLNKMQFNAQTSAVLNNGFTRTDVILAENGQPLPKGEYEVFVAESPDQPDEKVKALLPQYQPVKPALKAPSEIPEGTHFLFAKTYFLGGERDQTYLTRLKAFHDKVKQNAEKELMELKQYSDTLLLQFGILTNDFGKIYTAKKISNSAKNNWKKSSETWLQLNNQLEQTIQTWTKDTLQNEFFYGKVYELVKNSYDAMKKLFVLENSYVENPGDKVGFDIQHGKALSEARDANEALKSKVDLILKAPKTPSGLPTREGL